MDYKAWHNGLQSASGTIKYVKVDYKVWQRLQSVMGLQSMAVHTTATATTDIATTGTAKV